MNTIIKIKIETHWSLRAVVVVTWAALSYHTTPPPP